MNVDFVDRNPATAVSAPHASEVLQQDHQINVGNPILVDNIQVQALISHQANPIETPELQKQVSDAAGYDSVPNSSVSSFNLSVTIYAGSSAATIASCSAYLSKKDMALLAGLPLALTTIAAVVVAIINL